MSSMQDIRRHYRASFNAFIHISLKNKYLYVQTPKVASSTLKRALITLELKGTQIDPGRIGLHPDIIQSVHIKPYQLPEGLLSSVFLNSDFARFCFVRDPYARVLSAFLDKVKRREPEGKSFLRSKGLDEDQDITFDEFLTHLENDSDNSKNWDPHWRPQSHLLRPDLIDYSLIGKLETFDADYSKLDEILGKKLGDYQTQAPHKTEAASKETAFYGARGREIVSKVYKDDFSFFGYQTIL